MTTTKKIFIDFEKTSSRLMRLVAFEKENSISKVLLI